MFYLVAIAMLVAIWHILGASVSKLASTRQVRTFDEVRMPENFTRVMRMQHRLRLMKLYVQELERGAMYSGHMAVLVVTGGVNSLALSFVPELPKSKYLACILLMMLMVVVSYMADPMRADSKETD